MIADATPSEQVIDPTDFQDGDLDLVMPVRLRHPVSPRVADMETQGDEIDGFLLALRHDVSFRYKKVSKIAFYRSFGAVN
jgi:hypothetical protein